MASGIVEHPPVSRPAPAPADDVSVGEFVRDRVGDEVLDRLVEPLLGGVYAGRADALSLAAAGAPILALGEDLLAGAAAAKTTPDGARSSPAWTAALASFRPPWLRRQAPKSAPRPWSATSSAPMPVGP